MNPGASTPGNRVYELGKVNRLRVALDEANRLPFQR
jgi:hypothetical protein